MFEVNFLEVGAFHEACGDCVAMLTALSDLETRQKLLAVAPNLRKRNSWESMPEELAKHRPCDSRTQCRRAPACFNTFQFQIPSTLPSNGGRGN